MTPLEIRTLLDVYCYPNAQVRPHGIGQCVARGLATPKAGFAVRRNEQREWSIRGPVDAIPFTADHFTLTARGKAMVQALLQLPLPQGETVLETKWLIPGTDFEFAESEL